jgi:UDP-N-acetyl-2-amino-2-deoxyglucuronate dehydrogenase
MTLRVGIIGLGGVSGPHLDAYANVDEIEVVAAAEIDANRREAAVRRHGLTGYADFEKMLATERLDIACVLTPVATHRDVVVACARRGVNVLCEKPLATRLEDAQHMVAACDKAGVSLFYGASYRYLPAVIAAREIIRQGGLGNVLLLTESVIGGNGPSSHVPMSVIHYPEGGPGGSGMGLVDHGIHLIDLFPWLTDSGVDAISGRGNVSGQAPGTEFVMMRLSCGAIGQLLYNDGTFSASLPAEGVFSLGDAWSVTGPQSANTWHSEPGTICVYGTQGALRIFHYANRLYIRDKSGLREVPIDSPPPPVQFALQMESFAESLASGADPEVDGQDGIRALELLLQLY